MDIKSSPVKVILTVILSILLLAGIAISVPLLFFTINRSETTSTMNSAPDVVAPEDSKGGSVTDGGVNPIYPYTNNGGDGSKIVKNASLSLSVKDLDSAVSEIKGTLASTKGYIQSLTDTGTENKRQVLVTIRVPSTDYDSVISKLKDLSVEVVSASENADDISATYKDLQARLKNQKAYETQMLSLLSKATKVSDILEIQRELSTVREQIELLQSQIKLYDSQVDMSSITVKLTKASEAIDVNGDQWRAAGVFKEALLALVSFGKWLLTAGIWILVFSPIVILPAIIVWIITRRRK